MSPDNRRDLPNLNDEASAELCLVKVFLNGKFVDWSACLLLSFGTFTVAVGSDGVLLR